MSESETIAAIATPPGRGGVCIIRVSGSAASEIALSLLGRLPPARYATFSRFTDDKGQIIDEGLAIYFPAPHSFTGEDVLELHGHGGMVVSDMILQAVLAAGARMARPGEFSERAFINDKLDLAQAEAVADLIDAGSRQAARAAVRTLEGDFSRRVNELLDELTELRVYVESSMDFADEEIEFIESGDISNRLAGLTARIEELGELASRGRLLGEGLHLVIAGKPNAGKSSLMNVLSGRDSAIVTEIPGTTRDILREKIQIGGIPIHLHDTAGIREQVEPIEQEGIRRAKDSISSADLVLWVHDDTTTLVTEDLGTVDANKLLVVKNKIDLSGGSAGLCNEDGHNCVQVSIKNDLGMEELRQFILHHAHGEQLTENEFSARRRHLQALRHTGEFLHNARARLEEQLANAGTGELLAEELRLAQQSLAEVTGEFTSDDLLGKIFTEFCIGK